MTETDLFIGVNQAGDPNNLTDLEKKHIPVIEAPHCVNSKQFFDVSVEVGKMLAHPNLPGHFIEFIDIYADETFIARLDLTATSTCPKATLCISLDHPVVELRAYSRCNLHGVWIGRRSINVTQ